MSVPGICGSSTFSPPPFSACIRAANSTDTKRPPVGCLGLCDNGLVVAGLKTGVHLLDPANGALELLCDPDEGRADSRLNDGKVGPDGHFWVGTRDEAAVPTGNARLYRIAPDGGVELVINGDMFTSNGLAQDLDGTRMYHSDSSGLMYQAFDFDVATGRLGQPSACTISHPTKAGLMARRPIAKAVTGAPAFRPGVSTAFRRRANCLRYTGCRSKGRPCHVSAARTSKRSI